MREFCTSGSVGAPRGRPLGATRLMESAAQGEVVRNQHGKKSIPHVAARRQAHARDAKHLNAWLSNSRDAASSAAFLALHVRSGRSSSSCYRRRSIEASNDRVPCAGAWDIIVLLITRIRRGLLMILHMVAIGKGESTGVRW